MCLIGVAVRKVLQCRAAVGVNETDLHGLTECPLQQFASIMHAASTSLRLSRNVMGANTMLMWRMCLLALAKLRHGRLFQILRMRNVQIGVKRMRPHALQT